MSIETYGNKSVDTAVRRNYSFNRYTIENIEWLINKFI
jgi:hypothetical protein